MEYMVNQTVELLGFDKNEDEIDVFVVDGAYGNEFANLTQYLAWPKPGYNNWEPTGPGWARFVDTASKIKQCLDYQIEITPDAKDVFAHIVSSDNPDPNTGGNNACEITISPIAVSYTHLTLPTN